MIWPNEAVIKIGLEVGPASRLESEAPDGKNFDGIWDKTIRFGLSLLVLHHYSGRTNLPIFEAR